MKILIIEDSVLMRQRLSSSLSGHDTITRLEEAVNGEDGLKKFNEMDPDIIVLDISLPDISGFDLIDVFKDIKKEVIICVLTNFPPGYLKQLSIDKGADYFFYKSFDFNLCVDKVIELCSKQIECTK